MTSAELPPRPMPRLDGPERPFWQGLTEGEIRVQRCNACGHLRFPASRYCPVCHSPGSHWTAIGQEGEIESFCVFHKAYFPGLLPDMPYAVVQVRLDDGVRFFSNMLGLPNEALRTGMRVRAAFEPVGRDVTLLKFRPVGDRT